MPVNDFGSQVQELEVIEQTISFDDFEDDAPPPPHVLKPNILNGRCFRAREAVSESREQLFPASDAATKR